MILNRSAVWLSIFLLVQTLGAADTRLADAAMNRDLETVRSLVKMHVDVNVAQPDGTTALHWSAHWDDVEMTDVLLRAGAKGETANIYGDTPLLQACTNGSVHMVELLLNAGASPNARLPEGQTVLMTAVHTGNRDTVKLLLAHGADVNAAESWRGETALMFAAVEDHADVAQVLIDHGANLNAQSTIWPPIPPRPPKYGTPLHVAAGESDPPRGGLTPLLFSARHGSLATAKVLISAGADPNLTDPDGTSALVVAIINGHYDVAAFLLDHGANPNLADRFGRAALYAATDMHTLDGSTRPAPDEINAVDSVEIVKEALAHGADPNAQLMRPITPRGTLDTSDRVMGKGTTPFLRAAKGDDVTVIKVLLEHGADAKMVLPDHTTPLMLAAGRGWRDGASRGSETDAIEAIQLCQQIGFDINAANDQGETALHAAAAERRARKIVQFLVEHGANLNAKDKRGRTPLDAVEASRGGQGVEGIEARESTATLLRKLSNAEKSDKGELQ
jgi:uncharacterized protein